MSNEEIDRMYEVYERVPLNTPDEWGDLESFALANLKRLRRDEDVWEEWPADGPALSG